MTDLFTENAVTFEAGFSEAQVTSEVPKSLTDKVEKNTSDISDEVSNRESADIVLDGKISELKGDIVEINENVKQYVSPNILDKSSVLNGKRISTTKNSYTDAPWASCIPAIDVEPDTKLFFNFMPYQINFWYNDTLVGTLQSFNDEGNGWYSQTVYSNANCFAVEWNNSTSGYETEKSMISIDSIPDKYQPYGESHAILFGKKVATFDDLEEIKKEIENRTEENVLKCITVPKSKIKIGFRISNAISIGDKYNTISTSFRAITSADIPKNTIGIYVAGTKDSVYPKYAIVDSNDRVLKLSELDEADTQFNYGYYVDISDVADASKLYYELTVDAESSTLFFVYDKDDFNIYNGDYCSVVFDKAEKTMMKANGMGTYLMNVSQANNELNIRFNELKYARSVGIWVKLPSFANVSKLRNMTVEVYNDNTLATTGEAENPQCLQMENWVFLKVRTLDKAFNSLRITFTFANDVPMDCIVPILIGGNAIINHFNKPIMSIDFDQTWQQTLDCGAYDDLINNKIPWTITGQIAHGVEKLKEAHKNGLLDVGSYAGGTDGTTIGDTLPYNLIASYLEERIDAKNADGFNIPSSFGGGGHVIPPKLRRALKNYGYTSIKGGTMGGINSVTCKESEYIYLGCNVDLAMTLGGVYLYFAHGISTNPSGEDTPSMFDSYVNFKKVIDGIISNNNDGGILVLNMKQFSEFMASHKLM